MTIQVYVPALRTPNNFEFSATEWYFVSFSLLALMQINTWIRVSLAAAGNDKAHEVRLYGAV